MYVHLQKRQMAIETDETALDSSFYIIPNSFVPYGCALEDLFLRYPSSCVTVKSKEDYMIPFAKKINSLYICSKLNRKYIERKKAKRFKKLGFKNEDFDNRTIQDYIEGYMKEFYADKGILNQ